MNMNKKLRALQRKLERMELDNLRKHAAELHERVERLEAELERARDSAEFWYRNAQEMQNALDEDAYATHRCVGLNKSGQMMVVKIDEHN